MMNITDVRTQIAIIYSKRQLLCLYRLVACGKQNPAAQALLKQELLKLMSEERAFITKYTTLTELIELHRLLLDHHGAELALTDRITERFPYAWAVSPEKMAAELQQR